MENIKLGDLVQLKSGGPIMTVSAPSARTSSAFVCVWFAENDLKKESFTPVQLKLVKADK